MSTTKMLQDPKNVQTLDINQIEKRSWATNYPLSKLQTALAAKLSELTGVDHERLFLALERPKNDSFGHFSLPLPQLGLPNGTPAEHAKRLAGELSTAAPDLVFKAEAVGQFLNITTFHQTLMNSTLKTVLDMREDYGKTDIGAGKNILIDFCSCNVGKPFHAGHLRTTIIGNFIRNLYLSHGFHTLGMNYLGDWGKQYGLLAIGFKKYGSEEKLMADANRHLYDVYVQINKDMESDPTIDEEARKYFVQMERGDQEALGLWKKFRDLAVINYKVTLARLGVIHDIYSGESFYEELMKLRIQELKDKKLMEESNGAFVVNLEQYKLGKPLILKSDGATLYLTRDIAAAQDRFETYNLDKSIYVVACQQDLHFQQLFKILELMGKPWTHHMIHISYGMVKGMSTRKGTVVFLQDILDESKEVMLGVMKKNPAKYDEIEDPDATADKLAVSAIIVQDLGSKRVKDYEFKMDRMTRFEGDTGPYLQYAHARTASIYRKYGNEIAHDELAQANFELLSEPEAHAISLQLTRYPEIAQEALRTVEPCLIVSYCMALAKTISTALDRLYVSGQEKALATARLALYESARIVLGNAMRLLGLDPLERI
jgi:arginyl-tRNA synthetase